MILIDFLSKILDLIVNYSSNTEHINSMINSTSSWIIVLLAVVVLTPKLNIPSAFTRFEQHKRQKIKTLNEIIATESVDEDLIAAAKDVRDALYFKEITKIYAESKKRNALIKLHKQLNSNFTWEQIRLSLEYVDCIDESIKYKEFTKFNIANFYFNKIIGIGSAIFSFLILIYTLALFIAHSLTIYLALILLAQMSFMFVSGLGYLRQNWPYNAAEKIKEFLNSNQEENV
ncbi:hypothetical protein [uncultured Tolumonas sp.]|uniref:hypothetical protein n=1 Tax=uncultured Tolumonas sp. TaxID=263765 RepID=UPI00292CF964|nr:hypothetical protein [uncultured Tolumonas sp.]